MFAVAKASEFSRFNLTEDSKSFSQPCVGALYFPPDEGFLEIEQNILDSLVEKNRLKPLNSYQEAYVEFFPNEIFIEMSFDSVSEAEHFIKSVFVHFDMADSLHCEHIISKLHTFMSIMCSDKKLNCRFEVVSGNSCKRFHVDNVGARLIYTGAGPGTQIKLPDEDEFMTLASGSALIFKGESYPDFKLTTLHRSPPIEGKNIKRFLFVADYQ